MPHPETEVILGHRMRPARRAGRISPLCAPDPSPGAPLLMVRGHAAPATGATLQIGASTTSWSAAG